MINFKLLVSVFFLASSSVAYSDQDWSFKNIGEVTVISQQKGEWAAYFSGNRAEAVFCFVGPMTVVAEEVQTVKLKFGTGPWFDAPLVGYDHETLCAMDTKKARGLFGALVVHGTMSFSINQQGKVKMIEFDGSKLKEKIQVNLER